MVNGIYRFAQICSLIGAVSQVSDVAHYASCFNLRTHRCYFYSYEMFLAMHMQIYVFILIANLKSWKLLFYGTSNGKYLSITVAFGYEITK